MSNVEILPSGWAVLANDFISASQEARLSGDLSFDPFGSIPFCSRYWKEGDTVIDAGAHIGNFSVPMAKSVGLHGKVVCLEPDPELCECLRINMDRIGSPYDLLQKAAWEYTGQIVFLRNMENRGSSACDPEAKNRGHHIELTVDCIKIDDLGLSNVSFIKIDTEGSEWKVLKGAEHTLESDHPILFIETVPHAPHFFGTTLEQMYDWLRPIGYNLTFLPDAAPWSHDVLCLPT